jgi:hypothetical protein
MAAWAKKNEHPTHTANDVIFDIHQDRVAKLGDFKG